MKIIQIVTTLAYGDAVGNDVIALKKIIAERGYKTEIYAEYIDPRLPAETAKQINKLTYISKNDIVISHMAIATELNNWIKKQPCHKIMIYHNVTPPEFFEPYDKYADKQCKEGLEQTKELRETFDMVLADSDFNKQNLLDMGYKCPINVLPILISFNDYKKTPSEAILKKYDDDYTNIIFVGRIAPNKCQQDVIKAFYEYQAHYNKKSRLFIVGGGEGLYKNSLQVFIKKLEVQNVIFSGHCKFDEILAYYKLSDLFLCQSEHEGFCVPLAEAMFFNKPIVAYDSSAISWTLGGSGFLLKEKNPLLTAGVMDRILNDKALRETILENQWERLQDFQYEKVKALFWKYVDEFIKEKHLNFLVQNAEPHFAKNKPNICFVVQRYGEEVNGGAELLCRQYAEHLTKYYNIEVLTTKAVDYITWEDEYECDTEYINDVFVIRFAVEHPRNLDSFKSINGEFLTKGLPVSKEKDLINEQGPYVPKLIEYLKNHQNEYKATVFFTYLYYPTVIGIRNVSRNAIVMPFAHDEPFLKMKIFDDVFKRPNAIVYSTQAEKELINHKYHNGNIKSIIGGAGVDLPKSIDADRFKKKYGLDDYIVYVGRVDINKGCAELFDYFKKFKDQHKSNLKLVLMGKNEMEISQSADIVSLGFVNDQDKFDGIKGAKALILPSKFESLSLVVLEAMSVRTPVIVNGECKVLKVHCINSNGGFYYTNYKEFEKYLSFLLDSANEGKIEQLKSNAKTYISKNYEWDSIIKRFCALIEEITGNK